MMFLRLVGICMMCFACYWTWRLRDVAPSAPAPIFMTGLVIVAITLVERVPAH